MTGPFDRASNDGPARSVWVGDFTPGEGLVVVGSTPLPPPSVGSACILKGALPNPAGKEPEIASVSFLLQGSPMVEVIDGDATWCRKIRPGSFGIAPVNSRYLFRTEGAHTSLNLAITDQSIQEFARLELESRQPRVNLIACLDATQPHELFQLGLAFSQLIESPRKGATLYAQALWTQILLQLLWTHSSLSNDVRADEVEALSRSRIVVVTEFMAATLAEDISLNDLAAHAGLSPGYFLRSFKKATGKTPIQFRTDLRIDRARELLRQRSLQVSDIAIMLGFSSHSQFCAAFRRRLGVSPSAYRQLGEG